VVILLLLLGLFFAWPAWQQISPAEKQWIWSLLIFSLVIMLSFIVDAQWPAAFAKIERFARLTGIIPIYLLLRRFQPELLKPLLMGSALALVILFYQSITLYDVGDYGVSGIYYRIYFGDIVVLFTLWVVLGLAFLGRDKRVLAVGGVLVVMGLYATVVSMCRNAWLFLPVAAIVVGYLYRKRLTRGVALKALAVFFVAGLSLSIWPPASLKDGVQSAITSYHDFSTTDATKDSSIAARMKLWHDSLLMVKLNPLLGVGVGNFESARQELMDSGKTYPGKSYGHAHNIFLHALATTGLLGFFSLVAALFVLPWRLLYKKWIHFPSDPWQRFSVLGGLLSLLAFAHFGLSEAWLARNPFLNTYVLTVVLFVAATFNREASNSVSVNARPTVETEPGVMSGHHKFNQH